MAGGPSRQLTVRNKRPQRKRDWSSLFDAALSDRSHSVVAGACALASQPERELEVEFCSPKLGPAQCAWILVILVCSRVGDIGNLFRVSSTVQRDGGFSCADRYIQ